MKPLTIEQLKALEVGDWVWVVDKGARSSAYFKIIDTALMFDIISIDTSLWLNYSNYGKTWLAYKNKEQAEEDNNE